MARIQILPESVKNKIAAGEVVEGPFSVIKELMENSIDAEAKEIDVEVSDSGMKKISVKDNGTGILKNDLSLAVQNHATSKIRDFSDIERVSSYGFRGEALASISSISRLTIASRSTEEYLGARLVSENGHTEIADYAGSTGTIIIVENLFFNIPARKKFLSSKSAEQRKIREVFLKTALAHPEIGFSLGIDGKRSITLAGVSKIEDRISQVYGNSALENLYFENLKDIRAGISAFLSRPDFLKSTRSMQILYVNGRPVDYKYLGFLLSKAYEAIAPKGTHPVAIIFININPELIDVNIHPAKKEVKFFDRNYIDNLILNICAKALGKIHNLNIGKPRVLPPGSSDDRYQESSFKKNDNEFPRSLFSGQPEDTYNAYPENTASFISETRKLYNEIDDRLEFKYLGIIFDTYIVVLKNNALCFIDFHAAHERFIFDLLIDGTRKIETQSIIPQVIELSVEDYQIFLEKKDYFTHTAFDIDVFSDNSIVVRGIPAIIKDMNIEKFIFDILESLKLEKDHMEDISKAIAEKAACHSAKRSGDTLTIEDARIITEFALSGSSEKRCPHGRPFVFRLEKNDLEKVFKRI